MGARAGVWAVATLVLFVHMPAVAGARHRRGGVVRNTAAAEAEALERGLEESTTLHAALTDAYKNTALGEPAPDVSGLYGMTPLQASQDQLDDTAMAMDQEAHEMKELRKDSAKLDDNAIYARPQELRQAESAMAKSVLIAVGVVVGIVLLAMLVYCLSAYAKTPNHPNVGLTRADRATMAKEAEENAAKHNSRLLRIRAKAADLTSTLHRKQGPDPDTQLLTGA